MWWHVIRIKATAWCLFVLSLLAVVGWTRPQIPGLSPTDASDAKSKQAKSSCTQDTQSRFLMLVSTLDGQLAALDVDKQGKLEWRTEAGSTPLLSSSISKLEIAKNGIPFRLIPSLDGGLYQFDGENVEALPFTADTLLTSSSKLNEDSVIVGGRESMTYGVDIKTGQIRYICQSSGCNQYKDGATKASEDIIMIKRNTQTVRAVEMRTGEEKWNFSVGQHDLTFLEGDHPDMTREDDDVTITTCNSQDEAVKAKLKVFVPNGLVVAVDEEDPTRVLWKYQFGVPIAKAWTLNQGVLEEVSLFDYKNVPALGPEPGDSGKDVKKQPRPMLYLGFHQSQMYVQPSMSMTEEISESVEKMARSQGTDVLSMPKVKWKPYIATANSRTPIIHSKVPLLDYDGKKAVPTYPGVKRLEKDDNGAVIVKNDFDYPYDNGFYIFSHESGAPTTQLEGADDDVNTSGGAYQYITVINGSLWLWWKEVVLISLTTSVFLHLFINRYLHRGTVVILDSSGDDRKGSDSGVSLSQTHNVEMENEGPPQKSQSCPDFTPTVEFCSRYYNDFEHLRCLGKGGFGVVFEAKNKIDECSYAVKRICVKNSEEAKEKVMREARALAKLDHVGIVRYYQVWLETPPAGWQEERDADLVSCGEYVGTDTCSPTSLSAFTTKNTDRLAPMKEEAKVKNRIKNISPHSHHNPLRPFDDSGDSWSKDQSYGFSPNFRKDLENDESGSFSLGVGTPAQLEPLFSEDSEVIFTNSDSEDRSNSVPFKNYKDVSKKSVTFEDTNSSFNIVFEDSGCADRSSNGNEDILMENDLSEASSLNDIVVQGSKTSSDWSVSKTDVLRHSRSDMYIPRSAPETIPVKHVKPDLHSSISAVSSTAEKLPKLYLYIQMQLCRHDTLKEWLNSNTLRRNTHELLDFFHQIVSAVQYVHDSGLMHRDLKPSNIFFSMDGVIKIGDFGLVTTSAQKNEVAQFEGDQRYQDRHTDQVGTQLYMSPEQISSQTYSQKVDIFSLGLIFLELFFPFSTQMERIQVLTDAKKLRFPERFQRELPEECDFVKWLLSPTPDARPSAKEILNHKMLSDFQPVPKTHRSRTISTSSSGSEDQKK